MVCIYPCHAIKAVLNKINYNLPIFKCIIYRDMSKRINKLDFSFEKSKAYKPRLKKKKESSEKAIVFSKKIIALLEDKLKKSSLTNLSLQDLKKAYKLGFATINSDINKESLARVNALIRSLTNPKDLLNYFKFNSMEIVKGEITIKGDLLPNELDYEQASKDILEYNLEKFDFKDLDELYLEDEEDNNSRFDWEY